MIIHIDMDAFFASVEQAINPRLKDKPLIIGSRGSRTHTVVCAASYEAKRLGIHSGMPSAEAFQICPNLEFVPADQGKYIWTSEEIWKLVQRYGFPARYVSIDEFQIDIKDYNEPKAIAEKFQKDIQVNFRITASVGAAKNCILAKLASKINKPNGIMIITKDNLIKTLTGTPAEKLCGVGPKTTALLTSLGVNSCLDLYQKSETYLKRHLGTYGTGLLKSLHGNDSFDLQEEEKPKSVGHSYTLNNASKNPQFIKAWIRLLSEMVAQRLREQNLAGQTLHLWLNGPEIGNFSQQKTFQQATNDGYEINRQALKIMANLAPRTPKIRAIGVTSGNLVQANLYPYLLKEEAKRGVLLDAIDKINNRYGKGTIYPAVVDFAQS